MYLSFSFTPPYLAFTRSAGPLFFPVCISDAIKYSAPALGRINICILARWRTSSAFSAIHSISEVQTFICLAINDRRLLDAAVSLSVSACGAVSLLSWLDFHSKYVRASLEYRDQKDFSLCDRMLRTKPMIQIEMGQL